MPLAAFDKYKEIVIRFLDPSVLKKGVRAAILECYDDQKMGQMINFLRHPQIVSMTRREESSKSPQTAQAMQNFFSGLQASPPTEVRKRLIEKIDSVKHSSSFVVDMQAELFRAITWGMRGLSPADQRMTEEQLKQVALDMKAQLGTQWLHRQQLSQKNSLTSNPAKDLPTPAVPFSPPPLPPCRATTTWSPAMANSSVPPSPRLPWQYQTTCISDPRLRENPVSRSGHKDLAVSESPLSLPEHSDGCHHRSASLHGDNHRCRLARSSYRHRDNLDNYRKVAPTHY